jgi:hypothetical protein
VPDNFLQFDGSTGYVTVPNNAVLNVGTGDYTICFWCKFSGLNVQKVILDYFGTSTLIGYSVTTDSNGQPQSGYGDIDGVFVGLKATSAPIGSWFFFAFSVDRDGNNSLYLNNNSPIVGTDHYATSLDGATVMTIGQILDDSYFSGSLDDLRIYKKALSQAEVNTIYAGGVGKKYDIADAGAASWASNMDSLTAGVVVDEVGAVNGTKTGGVTLVSGGVPFVSSGGGGVVILDGSMLQWTW